MRPAEHGGQLGESEGWGEEAVYELRQGLATMLLQNALQKGEKCSRIFFKPGCCRGRQLTAACAAVAVVTTAVVTPYHLPLPFEPGMLPLLQASISSALAEWLGPHDQQSLLPFSLSSTAHLCHCHNRPYGRELTCANQKENETDKRRDRRQRNLDYRSSPRPVLIGAPVYFSFQ
jgi:hypothetical protein